MPSECRSDLVQVDGAPFAIRLVGAPADARRGLDVVACTDVLPLAAGPHTLTTAKGLDTGVDVDRVTLTSDRTGAPAPVTPAGAPASTAGTNVRVVSSSADAFDLRARTDGTPFWLVLGQSHNAGWTATVDGHSLGESQLVNGFANGWRITPRHTGTLHITLEWTPQRVVWVGLAVSGIAVLACIALVGFGLRRDRRHRGRARGGRCRQCSGRAIADRVPEPQPVHPDAGRCPPSEWASASPSCSRWWIGLLVAVATLAVPFVPGAACCSPRAHRLALAVGALFDIPELGWLALGLLAADLATGWLRARHRGPACPRSARPTRAERVRRLQLRGSTGISGSRPAAAAGVASEDGVGDCSDACSDGPPARRRSTSTTTSASTSTTASHANPSSLVKCVGQSRSADKRCRACATTT